VPTKKSTRANHKDKVKLSQSEQKFRNLAESLSAFIYRADPQTYVTTYVNHAVKKIYGYTPTEWLKDPLMWEKTLHPDDEERALQIVTKAQRKKKKFVMEYRIIRKDGAERWVSDHVAWEYGPQGTVISVNGVCYDITKRKKVEAELGISKQSFHNIVERSSEGIIIVDEEGIILYVNAATESLFLKKAKKLVGTTFGVPLASTESVELTILRKGGSLGIGELRVVPTQWLGQKAYLAMIRDITERKEHERQMLEAHEEVKLMVKELQEADIKKDEFIAITAHELKTPITIIRGFSELLLDKANSLPDRIMRFLSIIVQETTRLDKLITDILELSQLDLKMVPLQYTKVDLRSMIVDLQKSMSPTMKEAGLRFTLDIQKEVTKALIDQIKVEQILMNLIGNAMKFSHQGTVIRVSIKKKGNDLTFSVKDSGPGIARKYQDKLFKRFYQVDSSNTREIGGTGLGLAISKGLVELMGGTIGVKSTARKGSTFYFTVPLSEPSKKASS